MFCIWQMSRKPYASTAAVLRIPALLLQGATQDSDIDTYDIYLLPPNEDPETCSSWLRMRNRDGRYNLMFEEWVVEGPFIITPRISFEVGSPVILVMCSRKA